MMADVEAVEVVVVRDLVFTQSPGDRHGAAAQTPRPPDLCCVKKLAQFDLVLSGARGAATSRTWVLLDDRSKANGDLEADPRVATS
jgi:hypothetical protein